MGKSNRERRAAKKRKVERGYAQHRSTSGGRLGSTARLDLRWLLVATAERDGTAGWAARGSLGSCLRCVRGARSVRHQRGPR